MAIGRSWGLLAWASCWPAFALLVALLSGYRIIMTSQLVGMLEADDVPAISLFQNHLEALAWAALGGSGLCLIACMLLYRRLGISWRGLGLWASMAACGLLAGADAIWVLTDRVSFEETKPSSILDWLRVMAFPVAGIFFLTMTGGRQWETEEQIHRIRPWRYMVTFVFGASSAFVYALADHLAFWQPAWNGGHRYDRFLMEGEQTSVNIVLFSTSLLFASLVGLTAIICRACFRAFCIRESGGIGRMSAAQGRQALAVTMLWSVSLSWPWLLKLWPEIQSENAWLLPFAATSFIFAILTGPIGVTSNLMTRDELMKRQTSGPGEGASERTFLTATLFLFYPLLRWVPAKNPDRRRQMLLVAGMAFAGFLAWLAHVGHENFSFEDWRGMLKKSQLPYLGAFCSALFAFGIYASWRRFTNWRGYEPVGVGAPDKFRKECIFGRRLTWALFVLMPLGGAWSFWGWNGISENTFARTAEFSARHRFELLTLHWLFDRDNDGYASVLHGADVDDADPSLLAGGMAAVGPTYAEEDVFKIDNPHALQRFPNVVLLFLEGVNPDAVSSYGGRQLSRPTTPHLDELAAGGALFTNARVAYPSTWDTWYGTLSGRLLRIMEMSSKWKFGNRYSRLNNFRKVLEMCKMQRWCYPDAAGFAKLFLTDEDQRLNWQPWFNESLNEKDRANEFTRGDKRLKRMIGFIDDLKEGESFFLSEHMADTHFPWRRTSDERAKELGFPEGLEFSEEGAKTDQQKRYYQTITRMDGQIGAVTKRLKERGFYDQTCFIVVGDHGCQWNEHERGYYVSHLYEASIRIPLIIKLPTGAGITSLRVSAPVVPQDILPTLCEIVGVVHEENEVLGPLFGTSLLSLLDGREATEGSAKRYHRDLLLITHYDKIGVLHRDQWKLIFDRPVGTYRLFDLKNDPLEMINLADSEKMGMMRSLTRLLRSLGWRNRHFLGGIKWPEEEPEGQRPLP